MSAHSRPWLGGLAAGLALGAVLGAATTTRGGFGRGDLDDRLAALDALLRHVTVVDGPLDGLPGPHLIFEGVNVHVRSGAGGTDDGVLAGGTLTGLGNLIVGYNEPPEGLADGERVASHTLVVGDQHRYASWGGLLAGFANTVTDANATVSGGQFNTVTRFHGSISGGEFNLVGGAHGSISGGERNTVTGSGSTVSGGQQNTVSGFQASISGGQNNTVTHNQSSISGGQNNTVAATQASISGGQNNTVTGRRGSISGGDGLTVSVDQGWKAGTFASPP